MAATLRTDASPAVQTEADLLSHVVPSIDEQAWQATRKGMRYASNQRRRRRRNPTTSEK